MQERPSGSEHSDGRKSSPAVPTRLAGSVTIRELEERERRHRELETRAERREHYLRLLVISLVVIVALGSATTWMTLRSRSFAAEKSLKRIRMELEQQRTMIMRQAPLDVDNSMQDAEIQRKLEDAFAELLSANLQARVQAIPVAESLLAPRIPRAKARMKSAYPDLAVQFTRDLNSTQRVINDRRRVYNSAAKEYNRAVKTFPANLLHQPFGYPGHLDLLK